MNQLADLHQAPVAQLEMFHEHLKRAVVTYVGEFTSEHVESQSARVCVGIPPNMSNLRAPGYASGSREKTNLPRGSIKLRISHAEPTRSTSGRGRVCHTRALYSLVFALFPGLFGLFPLARISSSFISRSASLLLPQPKKSMAFKSFKRRF